jgi:S-formylglutathione hydrolase
MLNSYSEEVEFMSIQKLSRFVFVLFIFVLFVNPSFAQQAAKQTSAGKLVEIKIPAPSLKGNLLGDATEQSVSVYLPPSYDTAPSKRYPVVYLLHGFGGSNRTWTQDVGYGYNIAPLLDELINSGQVREMIVVAPNGRNAFGGSLYLNSATTGNWEDYIFRDVVGYVDTNYRTIVRPSSRGIAGHSMGGFGAISVGMKHADVFNAIYALSPCCLEPEGENDATNEAWRRIGKLTTLDQLPKRFQVRDAGFYTLVFAASSAAIAPNASRPPFYADFLYQEKDGKLLLNEAVSAKYKAIMPTNMVEDYKQNLLMMRGIFLDVGQNDEFFAIRNGTLLFARALAECGIPHTSEIYAGGKHSDKIKERLQTRVFKFFLKN